MKPAKHLKLVVDQEPSGPSATFIRRRFDPDAPHSPERFEPSKPVGKDDVWL